MPFASRDGVALAYERHAGALPPVVLIHGWCCDRSYLAPQAAHFAAAGRSVLELDLRGHGESDKPRQDYPIHGFADDVAWLVGTLAIQRPILVGHSMGGIIAYDIAARYPDLASAIVMIDSAVVLPERARAAIPPFLEKLRQPGYAEVVADYVGSNLFLPTDDAGRKAAILAAMAAAPHHVLLSAYAGLADYDAEDGKEAVTVPTLYIGANEASPRCDLARLGALVPQLQTGRTVGSGHFCQLEVPEQVNAMIDRFLKLSVGA